MTFTWDLPVAEKLLEAWKSVAPVRIGGPATGERGEDFTPGMYVKEGYTITSRGCPNRCWFCSVWKREGDIRELPIMDGWNVLDDNLLACSDRHIALVFRMVSQQSRRREFNGVEFTGGLEAKRLKAWHIPELLKLHPRQLFFAYDTDDDLEPLREAGKLMRVVGLGLTKKGKPSHRLRCYVLCGWPKDTIENADARMRETIYAGFTPMAMAWRGQDGKRSPEWARFQREWARPAIIHKANKVSSEREY